MLNRAVREKVARGTRRVWAVIKRGHDEKVKREEPDHPSSLELDHGGSGMQVE